MRKFLLLAAMAWFAFPAAAEVFWSFGRARPEWQQRLGWELMWEEPIRVNGVPMRLSGGITRINWPELGLFLQQLPDDASVAWNDDSVLIHWNPAPGRRQTLLISSVADALPLVVYGLERPEGELPAPVWPESLPPLPATRPQRVIEYPERDAVYGEFTAAAGSARTQLSAWGTTLQSAGWQPFALEAGTPTGSGEVYYRPATREILLLGTSSEETAFLYRRRR